jgi:protein-tyrosine phosphatase
MGNICRSPTAHGVFQHVINQEGFSDKITIDSAGTHGWHAGEAADTRSIKTALEKGYNLSFVRSRLVNEADFAAFDYILAMDADNLANLKKQSPTEHHDKIELFLNYTNLPVDEVPDPYYSGDQGFDYVLELIESASHGLLRHLRDSNKI